MRAESIRCGMCGGSVERCFEGYLCRSCGYLTLEGGRVICPKCQNGDCGDCESFHENRCDHECFYQIRYGEPYEVGFITVDDW